jgi:hypothetical protein
MCQRNVRVVVVDGIRRNKIGKGNDHMTYQDNLSELETKLNELLNDENVNDYTKVFIKDIIDNIIAMKKDESNCLIDSLLTFKEKTFCNKNFSDCLDCSNTNDCKMIQNICDLICNHKTI